MANINEWTLGSHIFHGAILRYVQALDDAELSDARVRDIETLGMPF